MVQVENKLPVKSLFCQQFRIELTEDIGCKAVRVHGAPGQPDGAFFTDATRFIFVSHNPAGETCIWAQDEYGQDIGGIRWETRAPLKQALQEFLRGCTDNFNFGIRLSSTHSSIDAQDCPNDIPVEWFN